MRTRKLTRRRFLGGLAAAAVPVRNVLGANESVVVALLGAGWRGGQLIPEFVRIPGVHLAAVCDPDSTRMAEKAAQAEKLTGRRPRTEKDLRRVLDDRSVDAVVVATPNHWHALATIWALQAGKHVYVEKPVAHSLWESQQMVRAARKYGRLVQVGTQRRSFPPIAAAMKRVVAGEFGRVVRARAVIYRYRESIGRRSTPLPIPPEIDYNLWAGPAPLRPLYRAKFHYDWHWFWETGNGDLGNLGSHMLDVIRWGLGQEQLAPAVVSLGGRFVWDDAGQTPNTQLVYFDYQPAPVLLELRNLPSRPGSKQMDRFAGLRQGFLFECEDAVVAGFNHVEIRDKRGRVVERAEPKDRHVHPANFIAAVRAGQEERLSCPVRTGHLSCGLALQGNISHLVGKRQPLAAVRAAVRGNRLCEEALDRMVHHLQAHGVDLNRDQLTVGPVLTFDPESERFTGEHAEAANRLLRRSSYRAPFVVPEVV